MTGIDNPAISKGSTVLVSGVNGYLGSNVADQFLRFGYKVRGTVRDAEKNAWVADLFQGEFGKDAFELVAVPDMAAEGAFSEAVKGASAVVHTASVMKIDSDPNKVIPGAIAGAANALKAALADPGVTRFVFTSSSSAAVTSARNVSGITLTEETWNTQAVEGAWKGPFDDPANISNVYAASKTQSEQEIWKVYKENRDKRPDLTVNTVLPNFNYGKILSPANQGSPSSSGFVTALWNNQILPMHTVIAPQYFIDVQDTGRLHVAAAISPTVQGQRILASVERFSWDKILAILRKRDAQRELPEDFSGGDDPNEVHPDADAKTLQLLRDLGIPGWTSLEESIGNQLDSVSG